MNVDIAIIGFGVIGSEFLSKFYQQYKGNKKINIVIVEKNLNNIPGGEAYSEYQSKFGFFNNPLRISNPEFINWIKNKKNNEKLINISLKKKFNLKKWLKDNHFFSEKKIEKFNELYVPRFFYSYFLEDKIYNCLKNYRKNIKVTFLRGEINKIIYQDFNFCSFKREATEYSYLFKKKKIFFKRKNYKTKSFQSDNIIIGTGILPPQTINRKKKFFNKNYIEDFYGSRGTTNLKNRVKNLLKINKKIKIIFIGNKAGLLEAMPELQKMTINYINKIKIICISPSTVSLKKAEFSTNYRSFSLSCLEYISHQNINKAEDIYNYIVKEFKIGSKNGFNNYDVWTTILKKNLLNKMYRYLPNEEKIKYNKYVFNKIRNMTRYTYPLTVNAKEKLEKDKILKFVVGRVQQISEVKKKLLIVDDRNKKIFGDIVINVSGPSNLMKTNKNINYIESLKNISKNFDSRAFFTSNSFLLKKNIYLPGTLSLNFNPNRLTIIKAITKNAHKVAKKISKKYNLKNG